MTREAFGPGANGCSARKIFSSRERKIDGRRNGLSALHVPARQYPAPKAAGGCAGSMSLRCSAVWRAASAARRRSAPARGSKSLRSRCRGGNLTLSPRPTAVAADRWCGTASYPARCARRPARGGGDSAFERQPAGASAAKYGAVGSCACDGKVAALRSSLRVSCWPRRPACLRGRAGKEAVIPRGRTLAAVVQIRRARRRNGGRGLRCGGGVPRSAAAVPARLVCARRYLPPRRGIPRPPPSGSPAGLRRRSAAAAAEAGAGVGVGL